MTIEENRDVVEVIENRGRVVAGQYPLVRTIFTYLPWKDLETSAKVVTSCHVTWHFVFVKVCKLWKEVFAICAKERRRYNSMR